MWDCELQEGKEKLHNTLNNYQNKPKIGKKDMPEDDEESIPQQIDMTLKLEKTKVSNREMIQWKSHSLRKETTQAPPRIQIINLMTRELSGHWNEHQD